jgi:hypothetical protein
MKIHHDPLTEPAAPAEWGAHNFFFGHRLWKLGFAAGLYAVIFVFRPVYAAGVDTTPEMGKEWGISQGEWIWYPWQLRHARSVIHFWYPYMNEEKKLWNRLNRISESLPRYKTETAKARSLRQMTLNLHGDSGGGSLNMGLSMEERGILMDLTLYKSEEDPQWYAYSSLGYKNNRFRGHIGFDNAEFSSANIEVDLWKW